MIYYAHPGEELIDHLKLTAELAGQNGLAFGHQHVCKQLGQLHDVGKRTSNFQKILQHDKHVHKQDHAIIAGIFYNTCCKSFNTNIWLRRHMALAMACHHSYLYSDNADILTKILLSEQYNLVFNHYQNEILTRMTKDNDKHIAWSSADEYNDIKKYINDEDLILSISDFDHFDISAMSENEKMLYTRMLFSCLVDADYSATSIVCNHIDKSKFDNTSIQVDACLSQLHAYYDDLAAKSDENEPVNQLRRIVFDSCQEKGSNLTGFVTLTAPTGTGKTLALMEFALEQAKKFKKDRIFVVLPFLSIIDQNSDIYKKIFGDDIVLVDDSQTDFTESTKLMSDRWSASIIVTTSVKFFETLFASKATKLRRLHNVANSVIVFDECQTLSSNVLNSTIELLQSLTQYYNCTVLFSTATKPSYEYRNHVEIDGNRKLSDMHWRADEIIDDVQSMFDSYAVIKNTSVSFDTDIEYTCFDLANYYANYDSAMYVFNTVAHAQEMYDELISRYNDDSVYIITSRFCPIDKKAIIDEINYKLKSNKSVRLASTQCIEAGVDFDFKVGAREYAPLDSIIQSAGRVCRNGRFDGKFLVFRFYKHDKYDYPSSSYKVASDISYKLAEQRKNINLYDLSFMNDYFKELYTNTISYRSDSFDLYEGYKYDCYKTVSDHYNIIDNNQQAMVIVRPFKADCSEYDAIVNRIISNNWIISKKDMKILSKYAVSVYLSKSFDISTIATQLYLNVNSPEYAVNYYLLRDDEHYGKRGLILKMDPSAGDFYGW